MKKPVSDESCDYVSCLIGCMEPDACNFDPLVIGTMGAATIHAALALDVVTMKACTGMKNNKPV